jgi:hypothetical protein
MHTFSITLLLLATYLTSIAQINSDKHFYPGTISIKTKQFNGTGGGGYWSIKMLDQKGRPVDEKLYRHGELLSHEIIQYNGFDDIIQMATIYDINNLRRSDTTRFEYTYSKINIELQYRHWSILDVDIYRLIDNQGDSVLTYEYVSLNEKNKENKYKKEFIFKYRNNNLYKKIETTHGLSEKDSAHISPKLSDKIPGTLKILELILQKEETTYEYFSNGLLKRRVIIRIPEPVMKGHYVGGPGSDDQSYSYKYDKKGRVKISYTHVNGKKYKLLTHQYIDR